MKLYKLILTLSLTSSYSLYSVEQQVSPVSLPETQVMKRDSIECDESCLRELLDRKDIFTFLSKVPENLKDVKLQEAKEKYQKAFNIDNKLVETEGRIDIAILIPENAIGRYSLTVSKAVFAYFLARNTKFIVKNFYIDNENKQTITQALEKISQDGFKYVIAPMTSTGASVIAKLKPNLQIFLPTINSIERTEENENILYGGIDYKIQISELLKEFNGHKISLFYDKSPKGEELHNEVLTQVTTLFPDTNISQKVGIDKNRADFSQYLKNNKKEPNLETLFLNTTVKKTAILLSQITTRNYQPRIILSTQINYSPILLSMTQEKDREKIVIANSIPLNIDKSVVNTNILLNNDIIYEWVNYSTVVGLDYIYSNVTDAKRLFSEEIIDGQIVYDVKIVKTTGSGFIELTKAELTK